jgi:hypothetical protein
VRLVRGSEFSVAEHAERRGELQARLSRVERVPDEAKIAQATKIAHDIDLAWRAASAERRKELLVRYRRASPLAERESLP